MTSHFRRSRRGASAIEFALVAPVVTALLLGMLDYGFLFSQQSQAMSMLTGAVRAANNVTPDLSEDDGECAACLATAKVHAAMVLEDLGIAIDGDQIVPRIEPIAGTCALTLSVDVPYEPIVGMVPTPDTYRIETASMLLSVDDC